MSGTAERPRAAGRADGHTFGGWEQRHAYGPKVHILDNVYLLTALARLSGQDVRHPEMTSIVRDVYKALMVTVAGQEFPRVKGEMPTRMAGLHPAEGVYRGEVLDRAEAAAPTVWEAPAAAAPVVRVARQRVEAAVEADAPVDAARPVR